MKSGHKMMPLMLLLIEGIFIVIKRVSRLTWAVIALSGFEEKNRELVLAGKVIEAEMLCVKTGAQIARRMSEGIDRMGSTLNKIVFPLRIQLRSC